MKTAAGGRYTFRNEVKVPMQEFIFPGPYQDRIVGTITINVEAEFMTILAPPPPPPKFVTCEIEMLASHGEAVNTAAVDEGKIEFRALNLGFSGSEDTPTFGLVFQCLVKAGLERYSQLSSVPVETCARNLVLSTGVWSGWQPFLNNKGGACTTKGENTLKVGLEPADAASEICAGPFRLQLRYPAKPQNVGRCINLSTPASCPVGMIVSGKKCICPKGTVQNGSACFVPPNGKCPDGLVEIKKKCVCPKGTSWKHGKCAP